MKKITFVYLLLFCIILNGMAQKPYSEAHLQNLSQEELEPYLVKARKLQKTGKTVNIVGGSILGGTAATILGMAIIDDGDWALAAAVVAFFGGVAGVGTLAVGIPMNVTGKKRVERINALINTTFHGQKIELTPCTQYNQFSQKYQPGVTLRLSF
jgi:hypothetical protein